MVEGLQGIFQNLDGIRSNRYPGESGQLVGLGRMVASFEVRLQIEGTLDVAIGGVEFQAAKLLQVRRLGLNEELVDGGDFHICDQS